MSATFTATPVIWVHVEDSAGGLIGRLHNWMGDTGIVAEAILASGPVFFAEGFAPDDAELVIAWLRENGCKQRRSG